MLLAPLRSTVEGSNAPYGCCLGPVLMDGLASPAMQSRQRENGLPLWTPSSLSPLVPDPSTGPPRSMVRDTQLLLGRQK
ncbi:hypothetical protein MRX96_058610 [Rhipicephalus microplus]